MNHQPKSSHLCFDALLSEFAVVAFSYLLLPHPGNKESNDIYIRNVVRLGFLSAVCTFSTHTKEFNCFTAI